MTKTDRLYRLMDRSLAMYAAAFNSGRSGAHFASKARRFANMANDARHAQNGGAK